MRALRVPTESYSLSIGLGALIPFLMVSALDWLPESLISVTILLAPFVAGFAASVTFGAVQTPGMRHQLLIGTFAFFAFYSLLWISVIFMGFRPTRELGITVHVTAILPPLLVIPVGISMVGSIFGWLSALALRR